MKIHHLVLLLASFLLSTTLAAQELEILSVPVLVNDLVYHQELDRLIGSVSSDTSEFVNSITLNVSSVASTNNATWSLCLPHPGKRPTREPNAVTGQIVA